MSARVSEFGVNEVKLSRRMKELTNWRRERREGKKFKVHYILL